ncbi:trypsin-like peptidase domain-containing protein [Streptomyces sp. KM273126]|uniref:trypsin-like peptidase domain-containing protein n=1 Tax=Streptomyces sp. KM273126 TaxID=2545247 RepID=UPI00140478E1|nr:trypsin-like peptidase domain-containing protein [Streptomyces sp. KM273126]MBA2813029.1 trypsin-like peptidase domain-containing protein [Streptomyces sp. KM273126]
MALHLHSDSPWRVRVDDEEGTPCGAGVLLDDQHVLTCAHVVRNAGAAPGGATSHVRISSVACRPEWTRTAHVAPGTWVHQHGTQRGDVALLELDEPAGCGTRTTLWKAPISGGTVRVYGFPRAEPFGMGADARLAGSGHRQGEWGLLKRLREGDPWIERGYSGAGAMAMGGEFDKRVIGIVVADYVDGDARAAWMLPTETMLKYLPRIEEFTGGDPNDALGHARGELPDDVLGDPLRLALTQELTRLLDSGWSGTVVVGTGGTTAVGDSWLVRLVRTADPAARATVTDAELSGAPRDTVLGLGAIDAAYDARGKSVADVSGYLTGRFALAGGDAREVRQQLLRRRPPACLVVGGVDRAKDPEALVRQLLGQLAARARSRGVRLVLGFEGTPPADLAYDVSLDPEPLRGDAARGVTADEVQTVVGQLAADEDAASALQQEWGVRFFAAPRLPPRAAPRLRVRLSVARATEPNPELTAVHDRAVDARAALARFDRDLRRLIATHKDLTAGLELHRVRAARYFGAEDRPLAERHAPAARALGTEPIDLVAARKLVRGYTDEVNRRIEEGVTRADGP